MRALICTTVLAAGLAIQAGQTTKRSFDQSAHPELPVPLPGSPSIDGRSADPNGVEPLSVLQMRRIVEIDRKKKIGEDTTKLVQLATELKAAVDKTTKDQMSLEVIHKAEQIEKVAHDLKERMRG